MPNRHETIFSERELEYDLAAQKAAFWRKINAGPPSNFELWLQAAPLEFALGGAALAFIAGALLSYALSFTV